jgi:hypothetical protein
MNGDPKYSKTVYDNLKQAYGDGFTKTYEEFDSKLADPEYAKTVYANLKQAYGDEFKRTEPEFIELVKKKEVTAQPVGGGTEIQFSGIGGSQSLPGGEMSGTKRQTTTPMFTCPHFIQ